MWVGKSKSSAASQWLNLQHFLLGIPCLLPRELKNWKGDTAPPLLFSWLASLVSGSERKLG